MQETIELAYKGHSYRLNDILVDKFCPSDLIEPGTAPLLLEQQRNNVHLSKSAEAALQQRPDLRVGYFCLQQHMPAGRACISVCIEECAHSPDHSQRALTSVSTRPQAQLAAELPGMQFCKGLARWT